MTKKAKMKNEKYRSEEQVEISHFIKILIIIIILVLGVYFFTRIFITKDFLNKKEEETSTTPGTVDYNTTIIGSMFNKPEDEYYVIIYDTMDLNAIYYASLVSRYKQNDKSLKVYIADLNNELNKKYIDENKPNIKTANLNEFKVGKLTLLKIRKGKITSAFNKEEEIAKELDYIKDTKK